MKAPIVKNIPKRINVRGKNYELYYDGAIGTILIKSAKQMAQNKYNDVIVRFFKIKSKSLFSDERLITRKAIYGRNKK